MTDPVQRPVFLERSGYRRRRLTDAAFLLPVFGAMLVAAPILWPVPADPDGPGAAVSTSGAIQYLFGVWLLLIVCACLFGRRVRRDRLAREETPPGAANVADAGRDAGPDGG